MDAARKILGLKVRAYRNEMDKLEAEIDTPSPSSRDLEAQLAVIRGKAESLQTAQDAVLQLLLEADDEVEYLAEEERKSEYHKQFALMESGVYDKIASMTPRTSGYGSGTQSRTDQYRINLPQRKLPEFSGNVRDWLAFWASFQAIDNDTVLPDDEKLIYLLQCVKENTEARKAIDSYVVAGKNYKAAIDTLKNRYGKPTMLVKVYVRDLLELVVQNAADPNKIDFTDLVSKLTSKIQNLAELGVTSDKCEDILYPILESCIPDDVMSTWQHQPTYSEKIDDFMQFLNAEVQKSLERSLTRMTFSSSSENKKSKPKNRETSQESPGNIATVTGFMNASGKQQQELCIFCDRKHSSLECMKATKMTLEDKRDAIKQKNCCFCCLKPGHSARKCRSFKFVICQKCGKHHYAILCPEMHGASSESSKPKDSSPAQSVTVDSINQVNQTQRKEVVLQTLTVNLQASETGEKRRTRAVYDGCSQSSYILESIAKELKLQKVGSETVNHHTFGGNVSEAVTHNLYRIYVSSLEGDIKYSFEVSGVEKISGKFLGIPKGEWVNICVARNIKLSDVEPLTQEIELMIGADVCAKFFTGKKFQLEGGPTANETLLGWVLSGKLPIAPRSVHNNTMSVVNMHNLDEQASTLWSLEVIGITDAAETKSRKEIEEETTRHFEKTVRRLDDGRYEVSLPWLEGRPRFKNNRSMAERMLEKTTADLLKHGKLEDYHSIITAWSKDGVIEEVPAEEIIKEDVKYLSHRAVYKENSTTPTRPVFNASGKSSKAEPSLNECLEKGPNLLELIPSVMTRFRMDKFGAVADIKKAFLQMSVRWEDRDAMRFVWWEDVNCKKIKVYRHCRVVFGVTSSPFLLGATLKYHLERVNDNKDVALRLLHSMYVDNCLISVSSMEDGEQFMKTSRSLLMPAKFDLRGWEFGPSPVEKQVPVLGMIWNTHTDMLQLDLRNVKKRLSAPATKRNLLSLANMVFDPLGFVAPFTMKPKLLFQEACGLKLKWDDYLPNDLTKQINKWKAEVLVLEDLRFPRWMAQESKKEKWSLHVCCDASSLSYAFCIFLRTEGKDRTEVQLVFAKTRMSPKKKPLTIPRLELLSCLLGARAAATVREYMMMPNSPTHYWTDSTTALAWIRNDGNWSKFVMGRVKEIRSLSSPDQWRHIPGEHNPADLPSRGCSAVRLLEESWWEGPQWMKLEEDQWPKSAAIADEGEVNAEKRKTVITALTVESEKSVIDRLLLRSDYHIILRTMAVILRYKKMLQLRRGVDTVNSDVTLFEEFTVNDLEEAEMYIIRHIQKTSFTGVNDKKLEKLRPELDSNGIMRMKSRLIWSDYDKDFKYPIILPGDNGFVRRMIWKEHHIMCHAGTNTLLAHLRNRYWITHGRRTISNVIMLCGKCRRLAAKRCEVEEAPLPSHRIVTNKPFEVTGVDLAGPLYLRGKQKAWIVLYTCAVYRAIHLEVVLSLSTVDFIDSLRRFVARRGRPSVICSDNGTNFVGCYNLFKQVDWKDVQRHTAVNRIQWRFNPPSAAWWGGFWERLIGSVKQLIRRVLGNSVVNYVQLVTLLCEVEATVNARPLTYVSEDATDLRPITPAMFLMHMGSTTLPEADVVNSKSLRKELKHEQRLRERLVTRFEKEYLGQVVSSGKVKNSGELKKDDVVLVHMHDRKRLEWPIGIVVEVYPSKDEKVRMVKVRTKDGEFSRPAQRLYPLELRSLDDFRSVPPPIQDNRVEKDEILSDEELDLEEDLMDDGTPPNPIMITRAGRVSKKPQRLEIN